jgi:hypothetical protein
MPIADLQIFIEECKDACIAVDLSQLAHQKQKVAQGLKLVIDAECCLDRLYGGPHANWIAGGQWNRMVDFLSSLHQACKKQGIQLVVFLNGALEKDRMEQWKLRETVSRNNMQIVMRRVGNGNLAPGSSQWVAPAALRNVLRLALLQVGITVRHSFEDHHKEVVSYSRENKFDGVLARDADYVFLKPPRYFSANFFKMTFNKKLSTQEYDVDAVLKVLGLSPERLALYASLLGDHFLSKEDLKDFYKGLTGKKEKMSFKDLVAEVCNFVKVLPSIDNLEVVAERVFVHDDESKFKAGLQKLQKSVEYWQKGMEKTSCQSDETVTSSSSILELETQLNISKITAAATKILEIEKEFDTPMPQRSYQEKLKKRTCKSQSFEVSLKKEDPGENVVLMANKEDPGYDTNSVLTKNIMLQENMIPQEDTVSQILENSLKEVDPKENFTSMANDEDFISGEGTISKTSENGNRITTEENLISLEDTASQILKDSLKEEDPKENFTSMATDEDFIPGEGTISKTSENGNGITTEEYLSMTTENNNVNTSTECLLSTENLISKEGRAFKEDTSSKEHVSNKDVISKTSQYIHEQHNNGTFHPWIHQIYFLREIKFDITFETALPRKEASTDAAENLPSAIDLFRPVRRSIYGILHDVRSKPEEVLVKEWFLARVGQGDGADFIPATPLDWDVPNLERLWFGREAADRTRRVRAWFSCMKSSNDLQTSEKVPYKFLFCCVVLRYLVNHAVKGKSLLTRPELDAFLATAVCPIIQNVQLTKEIKLPKVQARGLTLAGLFMHGVEMATLANDACGSPIPVNLTRPWDFFDGKIFHLKLLKASSGSPLIEVCDQQMDQLIQVERLKEAIIGSSKVVFACHSTPLPLTRAPGTSFSTASAARAPSSGTSATSRYQPSTFQTPSKYQPSTFQFYGPSQPTFQTQSRSNFGNPGNFSNGRLMTNQRSGLTGPTRGMSRSLTMQSEARAYVENCYRSTGSALVGNSHQGRGRNAGARSWQTRAADSTRNIGGYSSVDYRYPGHSFENIIETI